MGPILGNRADFDTKPSLRWSVVFTSKRESHDMWHRRRHEQATSERAGSNDPMSSAIWEAGHLTGSSSETPVIKAPRASDLAARDAA
jgi:hypothetical protein